MITAKDKTNSRCGDLFPSCLACRERPRRPPLHHLIGALAVIVTRSIFVIELAPSRSVFSRVSPLRARYFPSSIVTIRSIPGAVTMCFSPLG